MSRRDYYRGSQDCLLTGTDASNTAGTSASSIYSGEYSVVTLIREIRSPLYSK